MFVQLLVMSKYIYIWIDYKKGWEGGWIRIKKRIGGHYPIICTW